VLSDGEYQHNSVCGLRMCAFDITAYVADIAGVDYQDLSALGVGEVLQRS
jgi:hypothetical protein